jgi:hypothetical protein
MQGYDFFIGFVSTAVPDALDYYKEAEAPSNYKRPEAIAEYQQRARDSFLEDAALQAVTGGLTHVYIEDQDGKKMFSLASALPGVVSCGLMRWFRDSQFDNWPGDVGTSFTPTRRLWGFGIDKFLRMAGLEAMRYGPADGIGPYPPLRLWHQNSGAKDPYMIVTGGAERKVISLVGLLKYLDLTIDPDSINPGVNLQAHVNLAETARRLALRTGLVA